MYVANRREANDLAVLVNALAGGPREGTSVHAVASQTGLSSQRVAQLLGKHTDYFLKVGGRESFTLNKFGKCKGSGAATLADIERSYRFGNVVKIAVVVAGVVLLAGLAYMVVAMPR